MKAVHLLHVFRFRVNVGIGLLLVNTPILFFAGFTVTMLLFIFDWVSEKAGRMTYWKGTRTANKWVRRHLMNATILL